MGEPLDNLSPARCLLLLSLLLFMLLSVGQVFAVVLFPDACSSLGTADTIYNMTQNLTAASGTCITIAANNVTLDCKGYTINYSQTAAGYGIDINGYNFTTVKNCNIIQGGTESDSYGISLGSESGNSTIEDNNITSTNGYCISLSSSSDNTIRNNILDSTDGYGITLSDSSSGNKITDNTINATGTNVNYNAIAGFYLENSSNSNNITDNNVIVTDGFGVYITDNSTSNSFARNNVTATGSNVVGLYLEYYVDNNTFTNNTITSAYSIYLLSSSNNTVTGNNVTGDDAGIYLKSESVSSDYNTFTSNTITSANGIFIIAVFVGSDNLFYNNLINSSNPVTLISAGVNYWNTTLTEGTNIVGGPWIGGNFYAQPDGNGFSQSCLDDNLDIICDSYYYLDGEAANNIDYLPLAQPMGTITGMVLNPSGDPVSGANVHAEYTSISTTTNASGEYTLTLLVGAYTVTVSKDPIYISSSIYGIGVSEGETTPAPIISLQYGTGMGCGGNASIRGYIKNSTGGSIENAYIYVYPQISGGGIGEGGQGIGRDISNCYGSASSDANGSYIVFGLKAGIYTISVSPPYDSDYGSKDASDIVISGENETVSYNATLSLGGKIFGKIINSSGGGLAFMDVYAYTVSGAGWGSAQTQNGCGPVSNCSVWNNYLDGFCPMSGCYVKTPVCEGTAEISCSDILPTCSGNLQCEYITNGTSCQDVGCSWNATAYCAGTPEYETCNEYYINNSYCPDGYGCYFNESNESCEGTLNACEYYNVSSSCADNAPPGCTWDAADCSGTPTTDCSSMNASNCTDFSSAGCNVDNKCMTPGVNGCTWTPLCVGTPTVSCSSYDEWSCNTGGCWWDYGAYCEGPDPECEWQDPTPEEPDSGDEYCITPYYCSDGWDPDSCSTYPGCSWNSPSCEGEIFSCDTFNNDEPGCTSVGCTLSGACESDGSPLDCTLQNGQENSQSKCDIVTGCVWNPICIGTPAPCSEANESTCAIVSGCSWNSSAQECSGAPEACASQSPCDSPGCYWNSDPCWGEPSNGWQCDQLQAPDKNTCEMSACAWNASNIGKFMIKGLMLGTYSIQAQPQYWLQPPSEYAGKVFTDLVTISEEGENIDVENLTLGTAGVLKGCVTDSIGNPVLYAYLNAYSMDAGFGWAQTQQQGCNGTVYTCETFTGYEANYTCQSMGCNWSDTEIGDEYCFDTCNNAPDQDTCEGFNCTWDVGGEYCYNDVASSATDKATCEGSVVGIWKGCTGTPHPCEYWEYDSNGCPGSYGCTWGQKACYRITGLTTGTYLVEAYSPWYLSLPRTTVGNVAVTEGNETELNIKFGVSSSIYGYIQNSEGDGVPDVYFNVLTEGAGPYSPSEDWGWGMAQTVGCVGTPLDGCNDYCSDDQDCCDDEGCAWNDTGGYCYDPSLTPCNQHHPPVCGNFDGCSWDNRAFYNVSGLKGSDTRKYVVIAMPGYYNWYHNTSYSQKVNSSVTLPVGGSVEVNFTMTTGGSISGRVVDGNNNSINAGIGAYMPYSEGQIAYGVSGWARTNANGSYNITGLPAGTYEVQAYPWSGGFTSGHATVTVGEGVDYNLNFTLGAGGKISGRIIENGSAISSATIEVWSQDASVFAYGSAGTGSDGTFLVSGLDPADDYSATIRKISAYGGQESPTYISGISVVADQTTELGDIALIPVNGGIYGNATYADGSAIPNADVYAWSKDTMAFGWAQTNGSGYYSITGLPPGTYDTMLNLWSFSLSNQFTSVEVGTDPVLHNFGLAVPVSIYGYITDGGPISGAEVNIWNSETSVGMRDTTDENGLYNITIDSGTGYSMSVAAPGYGNYFNDSVDLTGDTELDVGLTSLSGLTTYIMDGNVTYTNGTGIRGASVVAYGGETASYFNVTDNSGSFSISDMLGDLEYNVTVIVGSTQSSGTVTAGVPASWTDGAGDAISILMHVPVVE